MLKHYIGHATVKNIGEFDMDLLVKNLSENVKLRPIIKEKNDEIKKLLSSYGFTFQKLFFSPEGREILVDDKNKTLVCINPISIHPRYGILEVFIAYKNKMMLENIIKIIKKDPSIGKLKEGTYIETKKISRYDEELKKLSPHGKILRDENNVNLCKKLYDDKIRKLIRNIISNFEDLPLPLDLIKTEIAKTTEEKKIVEKICNDQDLFEKKYVFVCKKCGYPSFHISFRDKEAAEKLLASSSFNCPNSECDSDEATIKEVFGVKRNVIKILTQGIWLEYMIGEILNKEMRKVWIGVMHDNDELDVVGVGLNKSILVECKDGSFGQNDLYSLMIQAGDIHADVVLIVTTQPVHPNVKATLDKYKEKGRRIMKIIEGDSTKIKNELNKFLSNLKEKFINTFFTWERGRFIPDFLESEEEFF